MRSSQPLPDTDIELSIILVSYNTRELLLACLESVREETQGIRYEVIVVDNGSKDGSAQAVRDEFPDIQLIASDDNLGFGRANNRAAAVARGEYLLLLNTDTLVLDRGIEKLLTFARAHPEAGAVGGRTLYGDRSLNETSCFDLPSLWSCACFALGLSSLFPGSRLLNPEHIGGWKRDSVREVGVITGCFLMIPRVLWTRLEGFDPAFFMYSEDTDLCARIHAEGLSCLHSPDATIVHYGGRSDRVPDQKKARVLLAKIQFFRKHWRPAAASAGALLLHMGVLGRVLLHGMRSTVGRGKESFGVWKRVRKAMRRGLPSPEHP